MKINILGTEYTIHNQNRDENRIFRNNDGYCDTSSKEIFICIFEKEEDSLKDYKSYMNKVLRHEIIHAFLFESGLSVNSDWAYNEEIVDWIAIQFPKLEKVFKEILNNKGEN